MPGQLMQNFKLMKRTKLNIIRRCKKLKRKDDKSENPTVYNYVSLKKGSKQIKVKLDKGLYYEESFMKLSEVEPVCTNKDLKRIKREDDATKVIVFHSLKKLVNFVNV